jgi:probable F420-dependent oxidoreductase
MMKFWQMLTWMEPDQIMEVGRFAEELGFEGVMMGDHGVYPRDIAANYPYSADGKPPMAPDSDYPDCWVTLGALGAVTTRLKTSVSIYVLPLRNVFEVARATGTLALLSDNRFILGAGLGWMKEEFDIYGVDFKTRGRRCDEMIDALRKLWAGGMVEHQGELIHFPALQIAPHPTRQVPIYMGGASPAALRRAATRADGWIGAGNTPEQVPTILNELHRLRADAGRSALPFETVVGLSTPPDVATFQRLYEQGMTSGVSYPFFYTCGPRSTLDAKKRAMEAFAKQFINRIH